MPHYQVERGVFLVEQPSIKNGLQIKHYAIFDAGNNFDNPAYSYRDVVSYHQTPPHFIDERVKDLGDWVFLDKIRDVMGARMRLDEVRQTPIYNLVDNNCEHVARYIAYGHKHSRQIVFGAGIAAVAALVVVDCLREE